MEIILSTGLNPSPTASAAAQGDAQLCAWLSTLESVALAHLKHFKCASVIKIFCDNFYTI